MKWLALLGAIISLCIFAFFVWEIWQRLSWRRKLEKMKRDAYFSGWLDRVDGCLRQFGRDTDDRREDDWFIDFQIGLTPEQAARKLVEHDRR